MKTKQKYPAHVEFGRSKPGRGKGKWRLRTRAENGNILMVTSEGYCNQAEMWKAVMASVEAIERQHAVLFPKEHAVQLPG